MGLCPSDRNAKQPSAKVCNQLIFSRGTSSGVTTRYQFDISAPNPQHHAATNTANIRLVDLENNSTFERAIPAAYIFHLRWILREAAAEGDPGSVQRKRAIWLQKVLDSFAEEIRFSGSLSDWRSRVLTPILMRAIHRVDDFDRDRIAAKAKAEQRVGSRRMTAGEWEDFYHTLDIVAPAHHDWWLMVKPMAPDSCVGIEEKIDSTGRDGEDVSSSKENEEIIDSRGVFIESEQGEYMSTYATNIVIADVAGIV